MSATDRDGFSKLNLIQYYGAMPVSQFNDLADTQKKIHTGDAGQAAKNIDLQASLSAVKDLAKMAHTDPNSPLYQVTPESTSLPDLQKWNGFVGKFGQALDDWRQNNNGKIPTDMQKRELARRILFPISGAGFAAAPAAANDGCGPATRDLHSPRQGRFARSSTRFTRNRCNKKSTSGEYKYQQE